MSFFQRTIFSRSVMAAVLSLGFAASAFAGTATGVTGLYTTGADANNDGRDDNWRMSSNGSGSRAYVVSNANVGSNGWYVPTSTKWISYASNGREDLNSGNYTYSLTFNITGGGGNGSTATGFTLFMSLVVDDSAVIRVNGGNSVSSRGSSQWTSSQNLSLTNGFRIGSNTITITVSNSGAGPTGVLVNSLYSNLNPVPEVGAWLPVAGALGLLAWLRLRPKKHHLPAAV